MVLLVMLTKVSISFFILNNKPMPKRCLRKTRLWHEIADPETSSG